MSHHTVHLVSHLMIIAWKNRIVILYSYAYIYTRHGLSTGTFPSFILVLYLRMSTDLIKTYPPPPKHIYTYIYTLTSQKTVLYMYEQFTIHTMSKTNPSNLKLFLNLLRIQPIEPYIYHLTFMCHIFLSSLFIFLSHISLLVVTDGGGGFKI